MKYVIIFVTVPGRKSAREITDKLIGGRLVACVNTVPGISSTYWWKGKVEKAREILLLMKTRKSMTGKVIRAVRKLHPYEVPEIVSVDIAGGNPDYLKWISACI
jgi:uncharacterized protein involved in tolerance to divalent cations